MVGVLGIEPRNDGTKNRCLTAWLHPIIEDMRSRFSLMNIYKKRGLRNMGFGLILHRLHLNYQIYPRFFITPHFNLPDESYETAGESGSVFAH
jgi:hypothetical protein